MRNPLMKFKNPNLFFIEWTDRQPQSNMPLCFGVVCQYIWGHKTVNRCQIGQICKVYMKGEYQKQTDNTCNGRQNLNR